MTTPGEKPPWDVMPSTYAKWQGGYSIDLGGGLSVAPSSSKPLTASPSGQQPPGQQMAPAHGAAAGGAPIASDAAGRSRWSILCLPIYPWMLAVGAAVYAVVSAPLSLVPRGLHLHFGVGIAAALLVIWLYRVFMAFLPTALMLAVPSALVSGVTAWSISDRGGIRRFATSVDWRVVGGSELWSSVRSHVPVGNWWVVSAVSFTLIVHVAYWWHRRVHRRRAARVGRR